MSLETWQPRSLSHTYLRRTWSREHSRRLVRPHHQTSCHRQCLTHHCSRPPNALHWIRFQTTSLRNKTSLGTGTGQHHRRTFQNNKRRYVLFICLLPLSGPNGWTDQDETWHRDSCWPRECFSQDQGQGHLSMRAVERIHSCATWRITMNHARSSISSSSSAVAGATWWMLIKLLREDRKGRENSSSKRDKSPSGGRVLTASNF